MTEKKYSVYAKQCPSRNILAGIGDKWSILIINLLTSKTYRFGEIRREIDGISAKVLTQNLLKLERLGFINKKAYDVLPPKVEYSLTSMGMELAAILQTLTHWTENNMDKIIHAEAQFSEKTAEPFD